VIEKIISGGQTGIDRAGLDVAIERKIPHGGWVPKGRLAEDGRVPDRYEMKEHPVAQYPGRTEWNIRDSDATAIFTMGLINSEAGCLLTLKLCRSLEKPHVVLNLGQPEEKLAEELAALLLDIKILNVAGPRGSRKPDVEKAKRVLRKALDKVA
jgi:NTP pyrophosphatase (non-canonical NTP hydrolase)